MKQNVERPYDGVEIRTLTSHSKQFSPLLPSKVKLFRVRAFQPNNVTKKPALLCVFQEIAQTQKEAHKLARFAHARYPFSNQRAARAGK